MGTWQRFGRTGSPDHAVPSLGASHPDALLQESRGRRGLIGAVAIAALCACAAGLGYIWYFVPNAVAYQIADAGPLTVDLSGPGILDATGRVVVSARIAGRLETVTVQRNDTVTHGMVLGRLAADDMAHQVAVAQADARAAQPVILELRSQRMAAEAAHRRAAAHLERRRALVRTAVVSRDDLEIAEADHQRTRAELDRLDAAIERAISQTTAAHANAQVVAARFDDAVIRAPIDGVVIARDRNPGDMISPGTPIFRLVDPDTLVVSARFDESVMGMLHVGASAAVRFNSEPQHSVAGAVQRLHREVDQETREFTADIALVSLPRNWALGQRATVVLRFTRDTHALTIHQRFLARRDGRPGVWLHRYGRAEWQPVHLGIPAGEHVEVTTGLTPGAVVLEPKGRYAFEPITLPGGGK